MPSDALNLTNDFFESTPRIVALDPGAKLLRGFAQSRGIELLAAITDILRISPFRHMITPGGPMSVAMTNCGVAGWVTDRTGYRYDSIDPETARSWPTMPQLFAELAAQAAESAGFPGFAPDACLVNRYEAGARLALHQDRNERDFGQPIVSVSLGLPSIFLWGGNKRADRPRRVPLFHGDVVVWGGPARMIYHGVHQLTEGTHPLAGPVRYNLTFRKAL
jgi:DNA oxidative demethylase